MVARKIAMLGLVVMAGACKTGPAESEIAARVNGAVITKKAFEAQVERNMERYKGQNRQLPPSIEARIRESVLRRMIDEELIAQKAKSIGVNVTPADLDAKFTEYKARFRTDQAFADYLKRSRNTEENMKDDLKRNLLRDQVVEKLTGEIKVSDEDVQKYYDENKDRFKEREQIKASRILLRVAPNATDAEKKAARKKAQEIKRKAMAKGADFAKLAKELSNGPQKSRGGDLGWFARGRMPAEFDAVAFDMAPNTVSDVVETKMGYEIIKVWDKKAERQRPLEEVKANIENSLLARQRNEKRREILRELKGNAKVETLITFEPPAPNKATRVASPDAPQPPMMPEKLGGHAKRPPRLPMRGGQRMPPPGAKPLQKRAPSAPGAQPPAAEAPAPTQQ